MLTKRSSLVTALAVSLALILTYGCKAPTEQELQLKNNTLQIQQAVQSELDNLDRDLSAAADELSRTGLSGPEAGQILNVLYNKYRFTIDFATADTDDKIINIVPEGYSGFEGAFISTESKGGSIGTEKVEKPVLRNVVVMFEFEHTDAVIWPILSENGDVIGSVSALFEPPKLFTWTGVPSLTGTGMAVNIIELDGRTIYYSQGNDIGKNLLTDPAYKPYKDLIALGKRVFARQSGSGSYTFIDYTTGKTVKKLAFWSTVGLHGTEWRVVSVQQVAE
ncbi:MAG: hypothetical protein MUO89_00980 [Dehalococcoidia bacterium]|nr:hypothetical protein [Dehalococcoidia bacterium]